MVELGVVLATMIGISRKRIFMGRACCRRQVLAGSVCAVLSVSAWCQNLYRMVQPLSDEHGKPVRLSAWNGKPAILAMEYTECTFICSTTLRQLQDTQATADRMGVSYEFIVISLDPKNDTPEAWQRYRRNRKLPRANWHFLTPRPADMPAFARELGVRYWYYDNHLVHDLRLVRVDAEGNVVGTLERFDSDPRDFLR